MLASELIQKLRRIVAEHGDLPVYQFDETGDIASEDIWVEDEQVNHNYAHLNLPKRILIAWWKFDDKKFDDNIRRIE